MKLGKYFTLEELTVSQTAARRGLSNRPGPDELHNLRQLVTKILDPLREALGTPIIVSSGYRSSQINALVGGAKHSQHLTGQAADIIVPGRPIAVVVDTIRHLQLPFDQVIDEFEQWTHVSYSPRHRREVLVARRVDRKTVYRRVD